VDKSKCDNTMAVSTRSHPIFSTDINLHGARIDSRAKGDLRYFEVSRQRGKGAAFDRGLMPSYLRTVKMVHS
jgi:hypothetical protein